MATLRAVPWSRLLSELSVIVVGVLIALAVDSWNTEREERALEAEYLRALAEDLRADSAALQDLFLPVGARKDSVLRTVAPAVRGLRAVDDTPAFLDAVALGGLLGTRNRLLLARRTTFDELTSSGRLALIRSRALRAALVDYYAATEVRSERLLSRVADYPMFVHAYYPAELRDRKTEADVRDFGVARAVRAFRSDAFLSMLNREMNFSFFAQRLFAEAAGHTNRTLARVEAERGRRE